MSNCPEKIELYGFVDGELSQLRWQLVDDHLPNCPVCRDEVRAIARLNRQLHRDVPIDLPEDFERSFRESLMARTVTSDEVRTFRRVLNAKKLAYLAAGFLMAVVGWSFIPTTSQSQEEEHAAQEIPQEKEQEGIQLARASFLRFLSESLAGQPSGSRVNVARLRSVRRQFERAGQNFVAFVGSRLKTADPQETEVLYGLLAATQRSQARSLLRRELRELPSQSPLRLRLLGTLVEYPRADTARLIGREARDHLKFLDAVRLLMKLPRARTWDVLASLCRQRIEDDPSQVVAVLSQIGDPRAEDMLMDLHFQGVQSDGLMAQLVSRKKVIERSRELVMSRSTSLDRKKRAMLLLGVQGDEVNAEILTTFMDDPKLRADAFQALSKIGSESAMLKLVHRLPQNPQSMNGRHQEEQTLMVEEAILSFDPRSVDFFARLASDGPSNHRNQYIQALGIIGGEEVLSRLYVLAENVQLREACVAAVVRIGSENSGEFLARMSRDQRKKIRLLARRGLRKLKKRQSSSSWAGFAMLDEEACRNQPRMLS